MNKLLKFSLFIFIFSLRINANEFLEKSPAMSPVFGASFTKAVLDLGPMITGKFNSIYESLWDKEVQQVASDITGSALDAGETAINKLSEIKFSENAINLVNNSAEYFDSTILPKLQSAFLNIQYGYEKAANAGKFAYEQRKKIIFIFVSTYMAYKMGKVSFNVLKWTAKKVGGLLGFGSSALANTSQNGSGDDVIVITNRDVTVKRKDNLSKSLNLLKTGLLTV